MNPLTDPLLGVKAKFGGVYPELIKALRSPNHLASLKRFYLGLINHGYYVHRVSDERPAQEYDCRLCVTYQRYDDDDGILEPFSSVSYYGALKYESGDVIYLTSKQLMALLYEIWA